MEMEDVEERSQTCAVCECELTPPYINCRQCPVTTYICLTCFSRGAEAGPHQSDHAYSVVRENFPLFEKNWTAEEELALLDAVMTHGYGNWSDIGRELNKQPSECERHYKKCYIDNPQSSLPKFPEYEPAFLPTPIPFKLSDNPPRPPEGSPLYRQMGGYNAARGDFVVEHNDFAELDICNMTFEEAGPDEDEEDVELMNEMKFAMLHSYRQQLKERQRRKKIVRDYGLINLLNDMRFNQRPVDRESARLHVFTTLMSPIRNDMLHEALTYEQELKDRICKLQEYRSNGLRYLSSIPMYEKLAARRAAFKQRPRLLDEVVNHIQDDQLSESWLQQQSTSDGSCKLIGVPRSRRRQPGPLKIEGLPGYEKLTPAQRELCASVRILPESFFEFSEILINESYKHGGLRLAQARNLIKIDVNKTRKLYDYLVQEGRITKIR